ncbi:MAG: hypothetical protein PUK21_04390 [Peptostreptococcaceae bacterium]|nr:hypothetical protein [Peptostreptococcaceae bacterium]MDY5739021.1 hypothetical protein [Anaerovoracaceae bacterium]
MLERFGLMLIIASVLMVVSIVILIIRSFRGKGKYDVFVIEGNELTVMLAIPIRYIIDDIEMVVFSKKQSLFTCTGVMKIVKKNGMISRGFLFDATAYHKKIVLDSTESEIDLVTKDLMGQLRKHGIECKREEDED